MSDVFVVLCVCSQCTGKTTSLVAHTNPLSTNSKRADRLMRAVVTGVNTSTSSTSHILTSSRAFTPTPLVEQAKSMDIRVIPYPRLLAKLALLRDTAPPAAHLARPALRLSDRAGVYHPVEHVFTDASHPHLYPGTHKLSPFTLPQHVAKYEATEEKAGRDVARERGGRCEICDVQYHDTLAGVSHTSTGNT